MKYVLQNSCDKNSNTLGAIYSKFGSSLAALVRPALSPRPWWYAARAPAGVALDLGF